MASIKQTTSAKDGKPRFTVHYCNDATGHGRRQTFLIIDDASELLWKVENSALGWRTAEIAEIRKAWTMQKLIWFFLGFQHSKLNRNAIKLTTYKKCRYDLLAITGGILKKNIMQVSARELEQGLSPGAQRWIYSAFNLLLEKKVISFNPQTKQKARTRKPITVPSKAAVKALLNDAPLRERIACWLGAVCGLRIGEVLALSYLDVSTEWINISKHITPDGKQEGLKRGVQRRVKMPRDLIPLLDAEKFGTPTPVIANLRTGAALSLSYSNQGILHKELQRRGVKVFHHLRHFAVSRIAERGVDILKVSRMIGHSNITTTMNTYGHLFGETIDLDFD